MHRTSRLGIGLASALALSACGGSTSVPPSAPVATAGANAATESSRAGAGAAPSGGAAGSATAGTKAPRAGAGGSTSGGDKAGQGGAGGSAGAAAPTEPFSFFVTSLKAMQKLSGNQHGFGGDLRFGETGDGAGLRGADKICATIAEDSMPGAGKKQWRAFLSTTRGGANGGPVHAIDRVGNGPWYDRLGRLVSKTKADLMMVRPATADTAIIDDLPNELGVPNHNPDGTGEVDNHDILTGSGADGRLYKDDMHVTCNDWTNSVPDVADAPRVGHSWPRRGGPGGGGRPRPPRDAPGDEDDDNGPPGGGFGDFNSEHWISALDESGCGAEASLVEMGPPIEDNPTVGSGGGYGGIYCFALTP